MNVGFKRIKWLKSRSAYQDMQYHRQRRAEFTKKHQAMMDAVNLAMSNAQHNKITGSSNLAAEAAVKRVREMALAKADELTKQIDDAKSLVDKTTASTGSSTGTSNILDTVA
jgi:hypothetical protein